MLDNRNKNVYYRIMLEEPGEIPKSVPEPQPQPGPDVIPPQRSMYEAEPWTDEDASKLKDKLVELGIISAEKQQPTPHILPNNALPAATLEGFLRLHGADNYVNSLRELDPEERHWRMSQFYTLVYNERVRKDFEALQGGSSTVDTQK